MEVVVRSPDSPAPRSTGREDPADVTTLLHAWRQGAPEAADRLFSVIYDPLRSVARNALRREHRPPYQTTALVHELFLRFHGDRLPDWRNRGHFYAIAARVMRRILVEAARHQGRMKRGGDMVRVDLEETLLTSGRRSDPLKMLSIDQALNRLEAVDEELVRLVELRFFAGFSVAETATALDCSPATVGRRWRYAKAWLYRELAHTEAR